MDAAKADVLGVHRVPPTALAKDLEHQPARASEQGTSDAGPECLLPNEVAVIRLVGAILANTTMAAGNTAEEVDKLRRGGDGHIVVWGGVSFWRSLMRLDLIDEFRQDLYPHVAGEDTGLFDDVPKSYRLDLVSSTAFSNGTVGLHYRRHR
jgi:dihydrofolate reductase